MKAILLLTTCLVAAHAASWADFQSSSKAARQTMKQCITGYKIDPKVLDNVDLYETLSDEQQGCVTACAYKGFNWLKPDGTLDIKTLTADDAPEEAAQFAKSVTECRAETGKNDCKFFHCLEKKDP